MSIVKYEIDSTVSEPIQTPWPGQVHRHEAKELQQSAKWATHETFAAASGFRSAVFTRKHMKKQTVKVAGY